MVLVLYCVVPQQHCWNMAKNYKDYQPKKTTGKGEAAEKNHKSAADIHLYSYFKGKLTNSLVSV